EHWITDKQTPTSDARQPFLFVDCLKNPAAQMAIVEGFGSGKLLERVVLSRKIIEQGSAGRTGFKVTLHFERVTAAQLLVELYLNYFFGFAAIHRYFFITRTCLWLGWSKRFCVGHGVRDAGATSLCQSAHLTCLLSLYKKNLQQRRATKPSDTLQRG